MSKGRIKVKAAGDTAGRELRKEAMDRGRAEEKEMWTRIGKLSSYLATLVG